MATIIHDHFFQFEDGFIIEKDEVRVKGKKFKSLIKEHGKIIEEHHGVFHAYWSENEEDTKQYEKNTIKSNSSVKSIIRIPKTNRFLRPKKGVKYLSER